MGKYASEVVMRHSRSAVWCQLVTYAARRDLAVWRVTRIAVIVSVDSRGDRLTWADGAVTGSAPIWGPALSTVVRGVVEFHIETLIELGWESIHRRLFRFER